MRPAHATAPLLLCAALFAACEKEYDLSQLPQPGGATLDTAYVELTPPFIGYAGAEDVIVGNDQLIYVADTRANRVVMMNTAGQVLSARTMLHPHCLAQDERLDLLVGGELVASNGDTMGAIYRLHLVSSSPDTAHHLDKSPVDTVWREPAHPARRFSGIATFYDNTYIAARFGPDNSSFIDPDGRVLLFDANDRFITPVPALTTGAGSGITNIYVPTGLAIFPGVKDFILVQTSQGVSYGAVWLAYQVTSDFIGWVPKFDPANPDQRSVDFIRPNRFLSPRSVAIDNARRDVFIADAGLDSVFKFNSRGAYKQESFGFYRSGGVMKQPVAVAYFATVLYVLDASTGSILRYRLTADIPH
ncbi:MAG TPA: hypothetical protein VMM80_09245 [Bacteroidota bacterium]|nr:hypothetical protein [Bacteroidota bacterium]